MARARKIVLTGGPCAGKTTLVQVIGRTFRREVAILPEAASLLFSGGFPRWKEPEAARAVQRAIYRVQCELEAAFLSHYPDKILITDRGTVDGAAYWPGGPAAFFDAIGSTQEKELGRYDRVLYLESAQREDYLAHAAQNPNRTESWDEARKLDVETRKLWVAHPRLTFISNDRSFDHKVAEVLELIGAELRAGAN